MRAARDAGNYPQLSRAYVIHGASLTVTIGSSRRTSREFIYATSAGGSLAPMYVRSGSRLGPRPTVLLRGDGDRRCVCEVNDIFQSVGVSLVLATLSLSLFSAYGRSVVFLTYRCRSRRMLWSSFRVRKSINCTRL